MKKAVLAALGILTLTCGGEGFESLAAETENAGLVTEARDLETEDGEPESIAETDTGEERLEIFTDTDHSDEEETAETDNQSAASAAEAEKAEIFVLMVLPCEDAVLSLLGDSEMNMEETVVCPVLISEDDLEELGEIGEDQIYFWTVPEEDPTVYLRACLVDGKMIFETEKEEETEAGIKEVQEYEAGGTEEAETAGETEDSTETTDSSTSKKKKSSSSSSKKKSSFRKSPEKSDTSSSSKKSSGKHKSASSGDTGEEETWADDETESSGEEESSRYRSSAKNEASGKEQEEASEADRNEGLSGETEAEKEDAEMNDPSYALSAAAGIGGLLAAAVFAFLRRRK